MSDLLNTLLRGLAPSAFDVDELAKKAAHRQKRKQHAEAAALFRAAAERARKTDDGRAAELLMRCGLSTSAMGDADAAVPLLEEAIRGSWSSHPEPQQLEAAHGELCWLARSDREAFDDRFEAALVHCLQLGWDFPAVPTEQERLLEVAFELGSYDLVARLLFLIRRRKPLSRAAKKRVDELWPLIGERQRNQVGRVSFDRSQGISDGFWGIIAAAERSDVRLARMLWRLPSADLVAFDLSVFDASSMISALHEEGLYVSKIGGHLSEDGITDFTDWIVSQGFAQWDTAADLDAAGLEKLYLRMDTEGTWVHLGGLVYEVGHARFGEWFAEARNRADQLGRVSEFSPVMRDPLSFWPLVEIARIDRAEALRRLEAIERKDISPLCRNYRVLVQQLHFWRWQRAVDLEPEAFERLCQWVVAQGRSAYLEIARDARWHEGTHPLQKEPPEDEPWLFHAIRDRYVGDFGALGRVAGHVC